MVGTSTTSFLSTDPNLNKARGSSAPTQTLSQTYDVLTPRKQNNPTAQVAVTPQKTNGAENNPNNSQRVDPAEANANSLRMAIGKEGLPMEGYIENFVRNVEGEIKYGFCIPRTAPGTRFFFHWRDFEGNVYDGQRVRFVVKNDPNQSSGNKLKAVKVAAIDPTEEEVHHGTVCKMPCDGEATHTQQQPGALIRDLDGKQLNFQLRPGKFANCGLRDSTRIQFQLAIVNDDIELSVVNVQRKKNDKKQKQKQKQNPKSDPTMADRMSNRRPPPVSTPPRIQSRKRAVSNPVRKLLPVEPLTAPADVPSVWGPPCNKHETNQENKGANAANWLKACHKRQQEEAEMAATQLVAEPNSAKINAEPNSARSKSGGHKQGPRTRARARSNPASNSLNLRSRNSDSTRGFKSLSSRQSRARTKQHISKKKRNSSTSPLRSGTHCNT